MEQIFNKVNSVDPNNSEAVKEAVSVFFQNVMKQKDTNCIKWLRELKKIVNRFPKYCMQHRINAENYLANFVNSNHYFNVIEAAKCAHALQQVRPTKEKTATPKSSWRDQMTMLCNTAHTLISTLFPNAVDIYKDSETTQVTATSPLSVALTDITKKNKNVKDKQSMLQTRLKTVFIFIQAMLVEIYPVAKPIRPQMILDVIVRALSVTSGTNMGVNVATVKIEALRTLDALNVSLGSNLIPYSPLIIRCVMQTLRWSSENLSEDHRKVRSTAYNTLSNWFNTLHIHRTSDNRNMWEDELTAHIVDDITPPKKIVQLTMGPQPTKHLSKKAKRKLATTQLQESTIAAHMPGEKNKIVVPEEVNNEVAIAALECAEVFFTVCGRFLKPATHKLIQERIVRECYNHSAYAGSHLIHLLRALEAARRTPPATAPPPTQYCLHLYSVLVNVQDAEISKFCTQALLDIRLHLHCSPPSLNFAIEIQQETEKENNKKKMISERNRAALESLLGPEKLPQANNKNEIITINDEPTSKKPRLEVDEDDKISLSSASVLSIATSDDSGEENMEVEICEQVNNTNNIDKDSEQIGDENEKDGTIIVSVHESKTPEDVPHTQEKSTLEIDKNQEKEVIFEATTQLPLNTSTDVEEERPLSLEVGYDYPSTGSEKVTIMERTEDENLPSTNDTDDIQITCGQVIKESEEVEIEKRDETDSQINNVPKVNGIEVVENGHVSEEEKTMENVESVAKITTKSDGISVEEMLADFVDEVVEAATEA